MPSQVNRRIFIYYLVFPLMVFALCYFSFYIGHRRAQRVCDAGGATDDVTLSKGQTASKEPEGEAEGLVESAKQEDDFVFFKALNEGGEVALPAGDSVSSRPRREKSSPGPAGIATTGRKGIVVQLSAFKDVGKAHELMDRLHNRGFHAFTISDDGSSAWHRVFVGPYDDVDKARESAKLLSDGGFGQGFVTTR